MKILQVFKKKDFPFILFLLLLIISSLIISIYNSVLFYNLADLYKVITGICIFLILWNSKKSPADINLGIILVFFSVFTLIHLYLN